MKRILKKEVIIAFIVGIILASSIAVYAYSYAAKDVSYTKPGTDTAINVETALNDLYSRSQVIYITGTNGKTDGIESFKVEHDNDNAAIYTAEVNLLYSINSTNDGDFHELAELGYNNGSLGFRYSSFSVKKGDIIYIKRDTNNKHGYAIVY